MEGHDRSRQTGQGDQPERRKALGQRIGRRWRDRTRLPHQNPEAGRDAGQGTCRARSPWPATGIVASATAVTEAEPENSPLQGYPVLTPAGRRMVPGYKGQPGSYPLPPESMEPEFSQPGAEKEKARRPQPGNSSGYREEKVPGIGAGTSP